MVSRRQPQAREVQGRPSLGVRHLAYWKALHQLQPYRFVPHTHLTTGHVRSEPLLMMMMLHGNAGNDWEEHIQMQAGAWLG